MTRAYNTATTQQNSGGAVNPFAAGKNFVINGNMNISQRGTSLASLSTGESYLVDRFALRNNNLGTATFSQETDAPAGFKTSAKILFTTADATPAASDFSYFRHKIESQALQSLQKGTATAKPITISFWVKSNVTGTYILQNYDPFNSRVISGSYSINTANTWEKKSITLVGDTSGALNNDNSTGLQIGFALGAGSDRTSGTLNTSWGSLVAANEQVGQVNVAAAVNNYWMITGVQVEIGSVATEFQLSTGSIQGELAACQRYYLKSYNQGTPPATASNTIGNFAYSAISSTATHNRGNIRFPVVMRTTPTITVYSTSTGTSAKLFNEQQSVDTDAGTQYLGETGFHFYANSGTPAVGQQLLFHYVASAEL